MTQLVRICDQPLDRYRSSLILLARSCQARDLRRCNLESTNLKNAFLTLVVWAAITWLGASAPAEDWPMYGRDGSRNAVSPEKNPPTDFQTEIHDNAGKVTTQARNVKWHADLGGTAYSFGSPVVSGGLAWFCTNNEGHRDPHFTKDMGCLICFDEQTGKFRWQYLTPRIGVRFVDDSFSSCGSTPLIAGDRLWFINNRWEVVCLDIGPLLKGTGEPREVWKLDMPRELKIAPFSTVMTPSMRCAIGASNEKAPVPSKETGANRTVKSAGAIFQVAKERHHVAASEHLRADFSVDHVGRRLCVHR